jgi:hypothetical protein
MPLPYTPQLCTLEYVRRHRGLKDTETSEDDLITQFIISASAEFQEGIKGGGRVLAPYLATTLEDFRDPYRLDFNDDVLELVEVTNGDSTLMDTTRLLLVPANSYPKRRMEVRFGASGIPFTYLDEPRQSIMLRAWRGCVPHYTTGAFRPSGALVPAGGLFSGDGSVALDSGEGALFETGQYVAATTGGLRELMQVTAIDGDLLTLARAELGTDAATHAEGTIIEIFTPPADVREAVRQMAVYFYLHKDAVGSRITTIDNGVVTVEDLDPRVQKTIDRYALVILTFGGV